MQKRGDLQGLVKGLFSPEKNPFLSVLSPTKQIESLLALPVKQGRRFCFSKSSLISADLIGQFGGLPQREPASHQHLENQIKHKQALPPKTGYPVLRRWEQSVIFWLAVGP